MFENVYIKIKDGECTAVGHAPDIILTLIDTLAGVACDHVRDAEMSPEDVHAKISVILYRQMHKRLRNPNPEEIYEQDISEEAAAEAIAAAEAEA